MFVMVEATTDVSKKYSCSEDTINDIAAAAVQKINYMTVGWCTECIMLLPLTCGSGI